MDIHLTKQELLNYFYWLSRDSWSLCGFSTSTGLSGMYFESVGGPKGLAYCNADFCIAVFRSFLGHCVLVQVSPEG